VTQKHYIILAAALAAARPPDSHGAQMLRWQLVRNSISRALKNDNPRFNESLFQKACAK
jgi:hypothetical protein